MDVKPKRWIPEKGEFVIWTRKSKNAMTFDIVETIPLRGNGLFLKTVYVISGEVKRGNTSFLCDIKADDKDITEIGSDYITYANGELNIRKATPGEIERYKELAVLEAI